MEGAEVSAEKLGCVGLVKTGGPDRRRGRKGMREMRRLLKLSK